MGLLRNLLLAGSRSAWLRERAVRSTLVRRSASRFLPGERLEGALAAARRLEERGCPTMLSHLGENVLRLDEAEAVTSHYLEVLDAALAERLAAQLSVKLTQLGLELDLARCGANLDRLLERVEERKSFLWIDMESSSCVDATLDVFRRARARSSRVGICLQAYLRRTPADLEALLPLGPAVRIVKGAYKEPPAVALARRSEVDEAFFALGSRIFRDDARRLGARLAVATHDPRLIERLQQVVARQGVPREAYEIQMLYGIQPRLQERLIAQGRPLSVLICYGSHWFPWYMRRLAERPANLLFVARSLFG